LNIIINSAYMFPWTGVNDSDVYNTTVFLDPAICYGTGETCSVAVNIVAMDMPDACPPNILDTTWHFFWLHGRPWVRVLAPVDGSFFACEDSGILVEIHGGAAPVDSNSIWFMIINEANDTDRYSIYHERLQLIIDVGPESLLYFDAPPGYFVEGETYEVCIVSLVDFGGDSARGLPICWSFTPDFAPPEVTGFLPAPDSLMPTPTPEISFQVNDELSGIDDEEIFVRIVDLVGVYTYDDTFYTSNSLVTWDGTNYKLDFHGSSYVFETGDTIQVCVYVPDNSIHCGPNATEFCQNFIMRLTGPTAEVYKSFTSM